MEPISMTVVFTAAITCVVNAVVSKTVVEVWDRCKRSTRAGAVQESQDGAVQENQDGAIQESQDGGVQEEHNRSSSSNHRSSSDQGSKLRFFKRSTQASSSSSSMYNSDHRKSDWGSSWCSCINVHCPQPSKQKKRNVS